MAVKTAVFSLRSLLQPTTPLRAATVQISARRLYSTTEKDASVMEQYKESESSFYKFPVEDISFKVGQHFLSKKPHPEVYFRDNETPGILHIAPWANAVFARFGKQGNLGKELRFNNNVRVVEKLQDAENEIAISDFPLDGSNGVNEMAREYFEWLGQIQDKYVAHLAENLQDYPPLVKSHYSRFKDDELRDILETDAIALDRSFKDPDTKADLENKFLSFRRPLFVGDQSKKTKPRFDTPEDIEMFEQGYSRVHVPVYQATTGSEIPMADVELKSGDVIAICSNIMCNLYDIGGNVSFGLRRNLRSINFYRAAAHGESGEDDVKLKIDV